MPEEIKRVKSDLIPGTDYYEIYPLARKYFNRIKGQTKRQPYVRSVYFNKSKVFIEIFWVHLNQKNRKERNKRLKYYICGIELLRNTKQQPTIKVNPNNTNELLYRFTGATVENKVFHIQIKENIRSKRKDLMSIFPGK